MIEIDEETVDKAIDDILGTDEPVRETETPSTGGAQMEKAEKSRKSYTNRCRTCGTFFETPNKYGQHCPACKRRRISEGQKARQAREHGAAPANDRQMKTGDEDPVQEAWAQLAEPTADFPAGTPQEEIPEAAGPQENATRRVGPEPETPEREPPEPEPTTGTMTADREDGAWGVLSALYSETRDAARTIGADAADVIEALFRMNAAMDYMWRKRGERA